MLLVYQEIPSQVFVTIKLHVRILKLPPNGTTRSMSPLDLEENGYCGHGIFRSLSLYQGIVLLQMGVHRLLIFVSTMMQRCTVKQTYY